MQAARSSLVCSKGSKDPVPDMLELMLDTSGCSCAAFKGMSSMLSALVVSDAALGRPAKVIRGLTFCDRLRCTCCTTPTGRAASLCTCCATMSQVGQQLDLFHSRSHGAYTI